MDAFLVSKLVENSLKAPKKYSLRRVKEHADFIAPNESFKFTAPSASVAPVNMSGANLTTDSQYNSNNLAVNPIAGDVYVTNVDVTNINADTQEDMVVNKKAERLSTTTFVLMLLINSYAAYLSWECNSKNNYPLTLKIMFSLFAFMFGSFYILYYVLFRFDTCNTFSNANSVF